MEFLRSHLLTGLIFSPLILGAAMFLVPAGKASWFRVWGLVSSFLVFVFSLCIYRRFQGESGALQFVERAGWIHQSGISYFIGIDGISLYLVLLTTLLTPIIFLSSWRAVEERVRDYAFFLLFLESTVLGAFLAQDLFLFYVFWEAMLIPMFFLIGVWGSAQRVYAAQKFLLYTAAGSVPMLVAIIYLVFQHKAQFGSYSAALPDLLRLSLPAGGAASAQGLVFIAFALAFAVKVPLFPLHTWLPDAHVQAPTGGSVILAGVLLKLGGYGFMRFAMPLAAAELPTFSPWFMWISAVAIVYGACVALVQDDIKKLVAYSSVSHMGYVILGLFSMNEIGHMGALYQMLNHGVSTGMLFLLVGVLYERKHTKEIRAYSGLARTVPLFTITMLIATFSSIALPGTNGFVGEFLILQGAFLAQPWVAVLGGLGVILGAVYMLWLCQRILFGRPDEEKSKGLTDLNWREAVYLLPLVFLVFWMGLYPRYFFGKMEPSLRQFSQRISAPAAAEVNHAYGN
ncbi:MAG: NADH-quinone oxidoreductase subunit M [Bdellovibrionales bacterium]|nr:NADH-quinone oxidoreductase subunit M [Bdellovibrionales bacterium]